MKIRGHPAGACPHVIPLTGNARYARGLAERQPPEMKNAIFYGNAVAINADLIASSSTSSLHLLPVQHCTRAAFEAMVASPSAPIHPIQAPGQWPQAVRPGRRPSAPRLQSSVHFESYDTSFCLIKRCTQPFLTRHPNVGAGGTLSPTADFGHEIV